LSFAVPFRGNAALWALVIVGIGLAVALPDPIQLGAGAVGLAVLVAAFIHPLAVLPLILLAVPFGSILRAAPDPTVETQTTELAIGATELLVGVLGAAWLARGVRRRELDIRASAPVAALLALLVLAMLSIGYADDRLAAIKETVKWVELLLVLLVVVDLVREPSTVRWVLATLFVAGAAEAAYGAVQFATGSGPETFALQGALRAFGHFEQPNPFAGYLTTILPMAILMALTPANPAWFRWLALASSGLLAVGIGLSQSRGAWLGAAVATVVLVALWHQQTRRLLLPAAFVAAILLVMASANLLPPSVFDRVAQAVEYFGVFDVRTVDPNSANFAVLERMAHWQAGWYMFQEQPWFGVGAGNYGDAYANYFIPGWPEALGHAHNYYLNMFAELGVLGGALLLVALALSFRALVPPLALSEDRAATLWRAVLAGAVGGLVVFCVHNLFDSLFVHSVQVQIGLLLGLGLVAAERLQERAS
jgi:O-antigen ligase